MPRHYILSCASLLALARPIFLGAQEGPTDARVHNGATLSEAVQAALRYNPDLLVAQASVDSAQAERRIARALPNPVLSGNPNTPYQYAASIPLDVTPQRYFRSRVASLGVAASMADRQDAERLVTLAVRRAFGDALLAQEKQQLAVARRDGVLQLLRADSARFRAGDVPERNLARSEVELARAEADVSRASAAVLAARLALQSSMGVAHPDSGFAALGSLTYAPFELHGDSLTIIARTHRPDRYASERRVEQGVNARRAAAALLVPTPQLAYVRQYTGPFESGHFFSLGLAFELPLLNLSLGQRERAAAGLAAAEANAHRTAAQIERDVASAVADFRAQRGLVERYQSGLLAKIDGNVDAVRYAYAQGAASLLEVLDAIQVRRDVRTEYVTALHDYWESIYALNAAAGADIFVIAP